MQTAKAPILGAFVVYSGRHDRETFEPTDGAQTLNKVRERSDTARTYERGAIVRRTT